MSIDSLENKKRRIAEELHDGFGQSLVAVRLSAEFMRRQSEGRETSKIAHNIVGLIDDLIQQFDTITAGLYPKTLELLGLEAALKEMMAYCDVPMELHCNLVAATNAVEALPLEKALILYRCVQEYIAWINECADIDGIKIVVEGQENAVQLVLIHGLSRDPHSFKQLLSIDLMQRIRAQGGDVEEYLDGSTCRVETRLPF